MRGEGGWEGGGYRGKGVGRGGRERKGKSEPSPEGEEHMLSCVAHNMLPRLKCYHV